MKTPRYTDAHRYTRPYADVEATKRPGYLKAKFARIRAERAAIKAEAAVVVTPLKRAAK